MASLTPSPVQQTTLDTQEQNLRIQKLEGEVDALTKPEWRRLSTWTGIVAISVAIFSFIVQGYYYKIQNAQALNDLHDVKGRIDSVTKAEAVIRTHFQLTRDSARADSIALVSTKALMAVATHDLDSTTRKFESIKVELAKLPGNQGQQAIRQFDQLVKNTRQTLTTQVESVPKAKPTDTVTGSVASSEGPHTIVSDDPQKNQWGGLSKLNGREMSAIVTKIADHTYRIVITVKSIDPSRPLTGDVTFHLHNTFRNQNPVVPVRDNEAVLSLVAVGSFTVGASVDGGQTKLEFDLVNAPGADEYFRTH